MASFHAMGTEVGVFTPSLPSDREMAIARTVAESFFRAERRFSRFRADSELSRLNAADRPMTVSPELFDALRSARRHYELTGGVFDPTIGSALVALGYDRSFAPGALDRTSVLSALSSTFADVALDDATRTVGKPRHVTIDLGGIVKGRTVDEAAAMLPVPGALDAGGDVVLRGAGGESGTGWIVDVEDPTDPRRTILGLSIRDRAVATSGPNRRRWKAGGETAHHLIDPRTQLPAVPGLAQVTVVAATAEFAEVLAKTAFILGADAGGELLERFAGIGAVLVHLDGRVRTIGELEVIDA